MVHTGAGVGSWPYHVALDPNISREQRIRAYLSKSNGDRGKLRGKQNEEEELPLVTPSSFTLSPEVLAIDSSA